MESASEIIAALGVHTLGLHDGCECTRFLIRGVEVDISCHKSSDSSWPDFYGNVVRVTRSHDDVKPEELERVAKVVTADMYGGASSLIRYCTFEQDRDCECCHCGRPRESKEGYICKACGTDRYGKEYDYTRLAFIEHEPTE